ncbi:type 4a pilus biogenesis protein PilO [Aneurinibacillus migulanus]|uniref:type 4a pilus biogenesis protein PilO n=1 Tax=Aneurinibacillus migulanus TaxID=47500 RepID=UPI00209ED8E7|nr:type 4a pilus biogenesis protein PilO [Aneurinibacillus migulanus]MCP1355317.1 type 4a pilus biogenesis protein PilO [Aneurinibacillus migulanus]
MDEKQRQYVLLGLAILFLLLAVFYYLYLTPVLEKKQETQIQLEQKKAELAIVNQKQTVKDSRPPQEKLRQIAELFPVKSYDDQLVKDFGELQSISNISIESATFEEKKEVQATELAKEIVPDKASESPPTAVETQEKVAEVTRADLEKYLPTSSVRSVQIKLGVKGDYRDIYAFVTEIQQMSRYLRVDKLSFNQKEKSDFKIPKDPRLEASLELTGYYAPQYASLLDKLPPVSVEPPSGKWDPTQYPVIKKEDVQTKNNTQPPSTS